MQTDLNNIYKFLTENSTKIAEDVTNFNPETDCEIQYTLTPVGEVFVDTENDGLTAKWLKQRGWEIKVRVYYQTVGQGNRYNAAELSVFAPANYIE